MAAFAPVVINDGATTPVAHTFAPVAINGTLASFSDRATGISIGYPSLTASLQVPTRTSRLNKVRVKTVMPVLEILGAVNAQGIAPAPVKGFDLTADTTFILPERASLQNRKDIAAMHTNALVNAIIKAMIVDLESIY